MPERPPSQWFKKVLPSLRRQYPKYSADRLDNIAAGIWHGFSPKKQESLTRKLEKNSPDLPAIIAKAIKDFGGWTSQNLDWERGYREGERKEEDRQRGIQVQRSRQAQLDKKQTHQLERYTNPDNPVRIEQRRERRAGLGYRAGERKEQHQEPGTVVASAGGKKDHLGPLADPEFHGEPFYEDAGEEPTYVDLGDVVEGKAKVQKQFYYGRPIVLPLKIKRYSLFMPFEVKVATKSFGEVKAGDLVVEGFVSAPIKDLQGDILEPPALVEAKEAMVRAPHNLI